MSKLTDNQNKIIGKAYELYLESMKSEEQQLNDKNLEIALNKFRERLKSWKTSDDVDFIINFALSDEARIFAGDGMAKISVPGFRTFMNKGEVKKKLKEIIDCKFNTEDYTQMNNSIAKYDIRDYLEKVELEESKPKLLTGRLLLMIFTELFTTIADENSLNNVCRKLEIPTKDRNGEIRYLSKHRQIRFKTDTYLKENNLYDGLTELGRARIGWFISEV